MKTKAKPQIVNKTDSCLPKSANSIIYQHNSKHQIINVIDTIIDQYCQLSRLTIFVAINGYIFDQALADNQFAVNVILRKIESILTPIYQSSRMLGLTSGNGEVRLVDNAKLQRIELNLGLYIKKRYSKLPMNSKTIDIRVIVGKNNQDYD